MADREPRVLAVRHALWAHGSCRQRVDRQPVVVAGKGKQQLRPVLEPGRAIVAHLVAIEALERKVGQQLRHQLLEPLRHGWAARMTEDKGKAHIAALGIGIEVGQAGVAQHAAVEVVVALFHPHHAQALLVGREPRRLLVDQAVPSAGRVDGLEDVGLVDNDFDYIGGVFHGVLLIDDLK